MCLFVSWLRTWVAFHIFGMFKNWNLEQTKYFETNFKPKNSRDKNLAREIIEYNINRLCQS